jgi:hypothetical protein
MADSYLFRYSFEPTNIITENLKKYKRLPTTSRFNASESFRQIGLRSKLAALNLLAAVTQTSSESSSLNAL